MGMGGIKNYLTELVLVFLALVVISLYPLIIFIFISLSIYRYVVQTIVKRDPKVVSIISGADACIAGRDPYAKAKMVTLPFFIYSSRVDKDEVMRIFTEKILKPRDNGGKCYYPELTQRIIRKFGYLFWYENDNFKLEDHIRHFNEHDPDAPIYRNDVQEMAFAKLAETPFNPNGSPWEILIIKNFIDPENPNAKSATIFRFQHCIFDGYSTANFMRRLAVNPWKNLGGTPKIPRLTTSQKILYYLALIFLGPYQLIKFLLCTSDHHKWTDASITNFQDRVNHDITKLIPLKTLKDIKNHFNVTLTSVLFTVMAEAVRRVMESQNVTTSKIHITLPFFLPGHPDRLTNHWALAKVPVLFQKDDELLTKTLRYVNKEYKKLQFSLQPIVMWYFSKLMGLLPTTLHVEPELVLKSTCLVSNFPGAGHIIDIFGYEMIDFGFGGRGTRGFAMVGGPLSYNGYLKLYLGGDASTYPHKKDATTLVNVVEEIINRWEVEVERRKEQKLTE